MTATEETAGRDPLVLLEEIRANVAAAEGMALPMPCRAMRRHVPRLLAGYDALLTLHRPDHRKVPLCDHCVARWPCATYSAIAAALSGEEIPS